MLQQQIRKRLRIIPALQDGGEINPGVLVNALGYITALAGYLFTILATPSLSLPVFIAFTAANILWFTCFVLLTSYSDNCSENQVHLLMLGLAVATLWAVALIFAGIALNWLLPVVTIAIFILVYPTRMALTISTILALSTMLLVLLVSIRAGHTLMQLFQDQITLTPAFLYAFTFPYFMRQQRQQRERAEALITELEAAQEQLRAHANQVEELAITRERNRMAREIHDTIGHYLTIIAVQLETALKLEEHGDPRLHHELVEARRVAAESLAEVRQSVSALRPTDLTRSTLTESLARLVREFESVLPETEIVLDTEDDIDQLAPELRMTLYRCVQEALTNVRKHAQASKVLVRLRVGDGQAELTVLDNGQRAAASAIDANDANDSNDGNAVPLGFGLQGMRERIALVGGTVQAGSVPGIGWRVDIRIPAGVGGSDDTAPANLIASVSAAGAGINR